MKTKILMVLIAAAVLATPSFAQETRQEMRMIQDDQMGDIWTDEYGMGEYLDNPCTSVQDWAYVDYRVYLTQEVRQASTNRYIIDESMSMGGSYSASGASKADIAYAQPFTVRQYHKVNTYDNFHVVTVIDFDPAARQSYVSIETACGNGLPGSPQ